MTLNLTIKGLRISDINVEISPRTALIAPNGSGKSTIINALRCAATGEVSVPAGNTPGALTTYSKNGTLTIECADGVGNGVTQVIDSPRKTKIPTLAGFDCRMANLQLSGSAESVRQFFADNLRPAEEYTIPAVAKLLGCAPEPAPSVMDFLLTRAKFAKAKSTAARADLKRVRALAEGLAGSAETVTSAGTSEQIAKKHAEILSQLAAKRAELQQNAREGERYNSIQTAAVNARMRLERLDAEILPTIPTKAQLNEAMERANAASEATKKARATLDELQQFEANAKTLEDSAQGAIGAFPERIDATICRSCGQEISPAHRAEVERNRASALERWKSIQQKRVAASERRNQFQVEVYNPTVQADANAQRNVADISNRIDSTTKARVAHEKALADAQIAVEETASAAADMQSPPDADSLRAEIASLELTKTGIEQSLQIARNREESAARIVRVRADVAAAELALESCDATEAKIATLRNDVMRRPVAELSRAMATSATALGADSVSFSVGDDTTAPEILIQFGGNTLPFAALSEGQRACFLAGVGAALLAKSTAHENRRMLLVECGGCDREIFLKIISMLTKVSIGYVVVAFPDNSADSPAFKMNINKMAKWATPAFAEKESAPVSALPEPFAGC